MYNIVAPPLGDESFAPKEPNCQILGKKEVLYSVRRTMNANTEVVFNYNCPIHLNHLRPTHR